MCSNVSIMEKNNKWTVYKHTSPSGKVYVGITNQPILKRWKNGLGYISCPYFFGAIIKYGWLNISHEIIASELGEEEAKNMEKELVKKYKNLNISYNLTEGGDGVCGFAYDEEHKANLSRTMKLYYKTHSHPLKGFKHSEESKLRMSISQKERWNPERRKEFSEKHKRAIIVTNINDGISKEYPSIKECSITLKIPTTSIGRHLRSSKPYKIYKFNYKEKSL